MPNAIAIENLTHAYKPGVPVLRGVNLHIEPGEIVGLIGLSGAGKSTLLRCVNGLVKQSGGSPAGTAAMLLNRQALQASR